MVEVMVCRDHELDVLEADPFSAQPGLERVKRFIGPRAGVDERQWRTAQQPDVHRTDVRQRCLDLNDALHGCDSADAEQGARN